jgi:predicted nuclease of predicted toxin-antitoxin system
MKVWLDAQLSPEIATWITRNFGYEAVAIRDLGLRDVSDIKIFKAAQMADVILITKDSDFSHLVQCLGIPPRIIWLRCGNTSNQRLRQIFEKSLREAVALLDQGETVVEITDLER